MKSIWMDLAFPIVLLIIFVMAILALFGVTKSLSNPPRVTITGSTNITTDQKEVVISGSTTPGAVVKVNKDTVTVDSKGNFSYAAKPADGLNYYNVTASKKNIAASTVTVKITKSVTAVVNNDSAATSASSGSNLTNTVDSNQLATSGPVDSAAGAFGITALLASIYLYFKSRKNNKATAYKLFT